MLDTLAAAYAEQGRFAEAVSTARRALARATQENLRALGTVSAFGSRCTKPVNRFANGTLRTHTAEGDPEFLDPAGQARLRLLPPCVTMSMP